LCGEDGTDNVDTPAQDHVVTVDDLRLPLSLLRSVDAVARHDEVFFDGEAALEMVGEVVDGGGGGEDVEAHEEAQDGEQLLAEQLMMDGVGLLQHLAAVAHWMGAVNGSCVAC